MTLTTPKPTRFFYHFRKGTGGMTVHFKGTCIPAQNVRCLTACETKWNKRQPRLVMRGYATHVVVSGGLAIIYKKVSGRSRS